MAKGMVEKAGDHLAGLCLGIGFRMLIKISKMLEITRPIGHVKDEGVPHLITDSRIRN